MSEEIKVFTVDLQGDVVHTEKDARYGDSNRFIVTVEDNGEPADLTGATAMVTIQRLDGDVKTVVGNIEGNMVTFTLIGDSLKIAGRVVGAIIFYYPDSRTSTADFTFIASYDPTRQGFKPDELEESLIETVLGEGPGVIADARQATQEATQATSTLTGAVGGAISSLNQDKAEALQQMDAKKAEVDEFLVDKGEEFDVAEFGRSQAFTDAQDQRAQDYAGFKSTVEEELETAIDTTKIQWKGTLANDAALAAVTGMQEGDVYRITNSATNGNLSRTVRYDGTAWVTTDLQDPTAINTLAVQLADLEQEFDTAVGAVTIDSEVVLARGEETTLGGRLDKIENDSAESLETVLKYTNKTLDETDTVSSGILRRYNGKPHMDILFSGNEIVTVTNAVSTQDSTYAKMGTTGLKLSITGGSKTVTVERILPLGVKNFHSICAWVYIHDATKISDIFFRLRDVDLVERAYSKSYLQSDGKQLKNGWNLIRFRTDDSPNFSTAWKDITRLRVLPITTPDNVETFVAIGGVWVEKFNKAKLVFIHDGAYAEFFNENNPGYKDLKSRNIPVVIASIPNKIQNNNPSYISKSRLYELSLENNNEISIHSFDGEDAIATMTPAQLKEESFNAINLLKTWGYNPLWRAAWFRNNAPSAMGSTGLFYGFAFHGAYSREERIEGFPFPAMYNIRRYQLHGRTNTITDTTFDKLKWTRGVLVAYTHNVKDASTGDISVADWNYLLSKIDQGITEGWLEGVTFKDLMQPYIGDGIESTFSKMK